jgi:hypothetical protein
MQSVDQARKEGGAVADVVFVGISVLFFIVSISYVNLCDRLMK